MRRVALLCPTSWDRTTLARTTGPIHDRFSVIPIGVDAEHDPSGFDAEAFIEATVTRCRQDPVEGVTSSSDYPGILVSAFVAQELGLPGPSPSAVLRSSHKFYARLAQTEVVPDATPKFGLIDPDALDERTLPLAFPFFVKPVKSWFSQYAQQVDTFEQLVDYVGSAGLRRQLNAFTRPFNALLERHGGFEVDGRYLIAEEILVGDQITYEGFVHGTRTDSVGIVDSVMYPDTLSFRYFGYPSRIVSSAVATRMRDIASRVMRWIGFQDGLFNIEFMYNEAEDTVHIIEVNPRMCAQFADMMEAVTGVNTYETLFSLALGEEPLPGVDGRYNVAASFALRRFGDALVVRAPSESVLTALKDLLPVTTVHLLYEAGQLLSDSDFEFDGESYRYAVINLAGMSWPRLFDDRVDAERLLDIELRAL